MGRRGGVVGDAGSRNPGRRPRVPASTNNRFLIFHDPFPAFTDHCLPAENFMTYHYLNFRKVRGTLVFYSDPEMIDYSAAT